MDKGIGRIKSSPAPRIRLRPASRPSNQRNAAPAKAQRPTVAMALLRLATNKYKAASPNDNSPEQVDASQSPSGRIDVTR